MKKIYSFIILLFPVILLFGQGTPSNLPPSQSGTSQTVTPTASQNYILTYTYRDSVSTHSSSLTTGQVNPLISYYDGLGRSMENVGVKGSQTGYDVISWQKYDTVGNPKSAYLPYTKNGNNGAFISASTFNSEQNTFLTGLYGSTDGSKGYTVNGYEKTPRCRLIAEGSPGAAWQLVRPVTTNYKINTSTDNVQTWLYTGDSYSSYTFSAGSLYVTETTDEDGVTQGVTQKEFKDKLGQLIQTEVNGAKTRYCYDQFNRLRCVVQPTATSPSSADNNFQYKYDERGRLKDKKISVGDWEYFIYDSRDRLALSQNGNQRSRSTPEWTYIIYDDQNRVTEQGYLSTNTTRSSLQTSVTGTLNWAQSQTRNAMNYLYYDIYTGFPSGNNYYANDATALGITRWTDNTGRRTGEHVRMLDWEGDMCVWLFTAFYYDRYGRVIQAVSDNQMGGKEYVTSKYNYAGELVQERTRHVADGTTTYADVWYDRDHRGRVMKVRQSINGTGEVLMAGNNYNEAGNLATEYLHSESGGAFLQKNDYTYNIRNWLTWMNDPATKKKAIRYKTDSLFQRKYFSYSSSCSASYALSRASCTSAGTFS